MTLRGYKQKSFATRLAITERTLRSWINEATAPDLRDLLRMEDAGLDIWYILSGERIQGISERRRDSYLPAESLAELIATLPLDSRDAELLKLLALRLSGRQSDSIQ